jgi:hypothetical protein
LDRAQSRYQSHQMILSIINACIRLGLLRALQQPHTHKKEIVEARKFMERGLKTLTKCEYCVNFKHRYMLLTGMHFHEIQKAIETQKITAMDFNCEGMGCQYWAEGVEIGYDMRNADWNCPHYKYFRRTLKNVTSEERLRIDSHADKNKYPPQLHLSMKDGNIIIMNSESTPSEYKKEG